MVRKFEIDWPDFGITIMANLLDEENPEICETFWQCLPFQTIFAASMSAGEMFKIPIPCTLPTASPEKLVLFPNDSPGTIFSLGMGSLLLKYGTTVEPFRIPRLARIPEEELVKLGSMAEKLREAYFFSKKIYIATIKKK